MQRFKPPSQRTLFLGPNRRFSSAFFLACICLLAGATAVFGQPVIDGRFEDWAGQPPIYSDARGDKSLGRIDFGRLWVNNDDRFLYLSFEVGGEIVLQEPNRIKLYIDTDSDIGTGDVFGDLGADLVWRFGDRTGSQISGGQTFPKDHADFGLVLAPTVSSVRFEIALDLDAGFASRKFFPNDRIRFALDESFGGDALPDAGDEAAYTIDRTVERPSVPVDLSRISEGDLRILSYNVEVDGFFEDSRLGSYSRVLSAVDPDVIGFQEIYAHTANQTRARVEQILPSTGDRQWFSAGEMDEQIVSRFPIIDWTPLDGSAAFLLDPRPHVESDLLVFVVHLKCCSDGDPTRQRQVDELMAFLRDGKDSGQIEGGTPFIILGDFNLVGDAQQLETLLTGDIQTPTPRFQPAFDPDWDATPLASVPALVTGMPMAFTWRNEFSDFSPGKLDYILYSDSVLEPANHFVLYTPGMSPDELAENGLFSADVTRASDHLPLVADFQTPQATANETETPDLNAGGGFELYPNPATGVIRIRLDNASEITRIEVFDVLGRRLQDIRPGHQVQVRLDMVDAPAGLYTVRVAGRKGVSSRIFVKQ